MFKPVDMFIALRYFAAAGRGNLLLSFISMLAILGMALGVALLIVVLSVMNGFDRELRERILSMVPHVQLIYQHGVADWQNQQRLISQLNHVTEVTPYNQVEGLIFSRRQSRPLQLLGLSVDKLPSGLKSMLDQQDLTIPHAGELLLAEPLAKELGIKPSQQVTVIVPATQSATTTTAHSFKLAGTFITHTELDQQLALASLQQVGNIAGIGALVQGFRVQVDDQFKARKIGYQLLDQLTYGYGFRDWLQTHGNLYRAIQLSRNMVGLLILLIVAIAAFNVVSMLMMSVVNKRKDIAVLQTLGLRRAKIIRLFLLQGAMIGLFGVAIGVVVGVAACYWVVDLVIWLEHIMGMSFLDTKVYPIDYIPVDLRWGDVASIVAVAAALNLLATIYPALRASRVAPADELRYEI